MSSAIFMKKAAFPYAEALFEFSKSKNILSEINRDLLILTDIISKTDILPGFLDNPLIEQKVKINVLQNILKKSISKYLLDFISIVIEKKRVSLLNVIIDEFFHLVYVLDSMTVVDLYSASVINEIQQQNLEKKLITITSSRKIKLIIHIKPELIGGMIIKIGSKVIDMSINGQLEQISLYLRNQKL